MISLEIGDDFIKLAEASFRKRQPIFRLIKKEFPSKEDNDISQEIANLFKEYNISQKRVFLNIPRHLVMTRVLHLPSINDNEIKNMAKIEAIKQMPYGDENITLGYRIIEKFKDGYSDILLAVIQASTINRLISILKKADLTIEKIALGSESLFGWYSVIRKKEKTTFVSVVLLNIDSKYINIDIIQRGKLVFTRAFFYSERSLIEEIKRTIAAYRKERNLNIDKIYLSGADNKIREIESILKEEIDVPLEQITQTRDIEFDKSGETDLGETSFIELIGLLLKNEDINIDLLPENMKKENESRLLKKNLLKTVVLLACIILIFSGVIAKNIFGKSRYLLLLNAKIKAMEPQVIKAKRIREDIKIIKNEIQKRPLTIDIFSEIYKITPKDITFNLLNYESSKSLILRGNASSLDEIIKFITILEDSPYFENVKIKYTAKKSITGKQVTDFEIICLLSKVK